MTTNEGMSLDEWQNMGAEEISLDQMDKLIASYKAARVAYEEADRVKSEKYKVYDEEEKKVIAALKSSNRKNYSVDGLGLAYIITKWVVPTPKSLEQKRGVFGWIRSKYGSDVADQYMSFNHQSLQSFYNKEKEIALQSKEEFAIPGLELPTEQVSLGFKKK